MSIPSTRAGTQKRRYLYGHAQELDNTGSLARDILATERTFLAWARTGLGFVGLGSALQTAYHRQETGGPQGTVSQGGGDQSSSSLASKVLPASVLLITNGCLLLIFSTHRYLTVLKALQQDRFPLHTTATLGAVALTACNTVAALAIVYRAESNHHMQQEHAVDKEKR